MSSFLDTAGAPMPIVQYEAFRRIDALPLSVPPHVWAAGELGMSETRDRASVGSTGTIAIPGWEFVGAVPAHAELEYNMIVPTLADSTVEGGIHYSVFFTRAATTDPGMFYDSPSDSGYSVDNLAPNVPAAFTVAYNAGSNLLTWSESEDEDFRHFRVYRDTDKHTIGFV